MFSITIPRSFRLIEANHTHWINGFQTGGKKIYLGCFPCSDCSGSFSQSSAHYEEIYKFTKFSIRLGVPSLECHGSENTKC